MVQVTEVGIAWIESPFGTLRVLANTEGVVSVDWMHLQSVDASDKTPQGFQPSLNESEAVDIAERASGELREYFAGNRQRFSVPVVLNGTAFQTSVWRALADIPYGQTCSYRDIAERIEASKAVRAVGQANRRNPVPILLPCHRVIGSDGKLVGYSGKNTDLKAQLLDLERAFAYTGNP